MLNLVVHIVTTEHERIITVLETSVSNSSVHDDAIYIAKVAYFWDLYWMNRFTAHYACYLLHSVTMSLYCRLRSDCFPIGVCTQFDLTDSITHSHLELSTFITWNSKKIWHDSSCDTDLQHWGLNQLRNPWYKPKRRNEGGWQRLRCSNWCNHVIAGGISGQSIFLLERKQ